MNGFANHGLDEAAFGEKSGFTEGLRTFDAFPKTKPTYTRRTTTGGYTTLLLVLFSAFLSLSELRRWYAGSETQQFSVEKGVSHTLQINLDTVVHMQCADLHVNVQDASGDRILAGEMLRKDPTSWGMWVDPKKVHRSGNKKDKRRREDLEVEDTHVGHVLGEVRKGRRKFKRTPKMGRGVQADSCRIFGSLEGNKVQGDFHITARGHGYNGFGEHLTHEAFNFSHLISELSFGPLYPSLLNPLDHTLATTPHHFNRFQYYLSIVPTIYTRSMNPAPLALAADPLSLGKNKRSTSLSPAAHVSANTVLTNQYAVTSQSHPVPEQSIPGIFFKFDIEPILLTIAESKGGFLALVVKLVNVVSGVLVGGGWMYQLWGWAGENFREKRGRGRGVSGGEGILRGGEGTDEEE
ncbi:hypothetical protein MMC30_000438 [Trapelia coarctata]|nr:hypothetical protein [Trapelia coarctata]